MGAEDFAYMLREKPGCYVWLGNGPGTGGCTLHNPHYDFNDDILPLGVSYWVRLVEAVLGGKAIKQTLLNGGARRRFFVTLHRPANGPVPQEWLGGLGAPMPNVPKNGGECPVQYSGTPRVLAEAGTPRP
jgi:hypothetical protein